MEKGRLAEEEGLFVSFSTGAAMGAAMGAAIKVAGKLDAFGESAVMMAILCD